MNTTFKISDDQNTITHESGLVTEFVESRHKYPTIRDCSLCYYCDSINCKTLPCYHTNKKHGYFVKKSE